MLSVEHVGAGQTVFQDVGTFEYEAGTEIRLANPTGLGLSLVTDLVMYRLQTDGFEETKESPESVEETVSSFEDNPVSIEDASTPNEDKQAEDVVKPSPRINPAIVVQGHYLILYGGVVEVFDEKCVI